MTVLTPPSAQHGRQDDCEYGLPWVAYQRHAMNAVDRCLRSDLPSLADRPGDRRPDATVRFALAVLPLPSLRNPLVCGEEPGEEQRGE